MKIQHTPGPWYSKNTASDQAAISSETTGRTVAVAYNSKDGAILAAAPDLLEKLQLVIKYHDPRVNPLLDAAILSAQHLIAEIEHGTEK